MHTSKNKVSKDLVSQSFDKFQAEQVNRLEYRGQQYPNQQNLNQSYNPDQMRMSQNIYGRQHYQTENSNSLQPNLNMTQDQQLYSDNGFYNDGRAGQGYNTSHPEYAHTQQEQQHFQQVDSQNNNLRREYRPPQKTGDASQSARPTWNLSLSKINTSVLNFRRLSNLRSKSRVIKISGVRLDMTPNLHHHLQKIGDVIELQMKWIEKGDMQVKFKSEKSAKEAMEKLDGMEMNGSKLQVTQMFQLKSFKPKLKMGFPCTKLTKIQETEDSDDGEVEFSDEDYSLAKSSEEKQTRDKIVKNISDVIDNHDDNKDPS